MATRKDVLQGLAGVGTGFSKMGQMMMERERFDTQKALEEEENERKRALHPPQLEGTQAGASLAKTQASEALATAGKREQADLANQGLMAENEAAGWHVDPEDQGQVGTWKAELNAVNRFRAKEGKPAMSVTEYVTGKKQEKFERTSAQEKHGSDMKTAETNRTLTLAQVNREKEGGKRDRFKEITDEAGNVFRWNMDTNEVSPAGIKKGIAGVKPIDMPAVQAQAEQGIALIDQMIGVKEDPEKGVKGTKPHPGFRASVGAKGASSFFGLKDEPLAGTDAADFKALYDQVTGQAFMEAFQNLRGGGTITEQEGKKASAAITRMSTAQSERDFITAAREFQGIIQAGLERAKAKAATQGKSSATAPALPAPSGKTTKVGRFQVEEG